MADIKNKKLSSKQISYRCWLLFFTFFKIGLFVVGGGLAMLPVIEEVFVRKRKWLTKKEMLDMVVLTQTVPGLIAVNSSLYVGSCIAKFWGSLAALAGVCLPSVIIICVIVAFFPNLNPSNPYVLSGFLSIRASITGVFAATAWRLGKSIVKTFYDAALVTFLLLLLLTNINPIYVILLSMPIGVFLLAKRRLQEKGVLND